MKRVEGGLSTRNVGQERVARDHNTCEVNRFLCCQGYNTLVRPVLGASGQLNHETMGHTVRVLVTVKVGL